MAFIRCFAMLHAPPQIIAVKRCSTGGDRLQTALASATALPRIKKPGSRENFRAIPTEKLCLKSARQHLERRNGGNGVKPQPGILGKEMRMLLRQLQRDGLAGLAGRVVGDRYGKA